MARRTGQPEHIRVELPLRAQAGHGLDFDYPTVTDAGEVPAAKACLGAPSPQMKDMVRKVATFLHDEGAEHIDVVPDMRAKGMPGNLTVRWMGAVPALKVAQEFAVAVGDDGTPRVPAWLCLRRDDDFDLRWQPPY
jgi:hypothetical protein